MESKVNYTVVGFFVITLSVILLLLIFWFSALSHEKNYKTYLVYVKEDVTGLTVDSPVRYNGVPVGTVKSIEINPHNLQEVKLTLLIEDGTPITTATYATLQFQGITGVLYVGLTNRSLGAPPLKARADEKYPVIPAQPSLLLQLSQAIPTITKSIEVIGDRVNHLLDDENQDAIKSSLQNIETFSDMLSDNSEKLSDSIELLHKTLKNTSVASEKLPVMAQNFNSSLNSVRSAAKSVQTITQNISEQVVPSTQQILNELNVVGNNLQQLTTELQRNPSMLVRGKELPPPGPGER